MVEEVADGNCSSIIGKIGKDVGQTVFVVELTVMYQEHYRHGSKLLGERCQPKIGKLVDLVQGLETGNAIAALKHGSAGFADQYGAAGSIVRFETGKNCANSIRIILITSEA